MRPVSAVTICIALAVSAAACFSYMDDEAPAADATSDLDRPTDARRALRDACRRVERHFDGRSPRSLHDWRIRRCHAAGCERTVPYDQTVFVRRPDDRRARHEYVHACLFATGKVDGHHDWMRDHCQFCYDSPACREACD